MTQMVLNNRLRGLKGSLELCDVWMSIEFYWDVTFSMRKLTIGGGTRSR
ncbi:hypothetical protein A2U01_0101190, partial [Trifolium medium]|nr:hypothetical protein [Trifolium medium]